MQICSDSAGVVFGGALDGLAKRLGLRPAQLTAAQRAQPATRRVGLLGALAGVAYEASTVAGFQGREKAVIVLRCVRAARADRTAPRPPRPSSAARAMSVSPSCCWS